MVRIIFYTLIYLVTVLFSAAFFDSHINKPQGKLGFLKRNQNVDTWTAINTNGVCVIDREKDVSMFLLRRISYL